jgi:hypothetical protein
MGLLQSVATQTDECNAHRYCPQFDCSYSGDKAEFILKWSALSDQLSATTKKQDLVAFAES